MRIVTDDELKKLAQIAVDGYLKHKMPLENTLLKIATESALNPDQIRNLVQLANTMTHLALFDRKNDGDKIIEFEPADPAIIIRRIYISGEPEDSDVPCEPKETASPMDMFSDLSAVLNKVKTMLRGKEESPAEDISEQELIPEEKAEGLSPVKRQLLILKIRKVASELESRQHQTTFEYKEELDKLAAEFAKLYGLDFETFEKDAYALRGELALPIIADLRNCLKKPKLVDRRHLKTARVVDSQTKEMRGLDRLIKLHDDWQVLDRARKQLSENLGDYL